MVTYNGGEQSPSWNSYNPETLTLGGTTTATNAGTYTATFTPKGKYKWTDGTQTPKQVTWTINRATVSVPSQSGSLTYTGSTQSPTWAGYDSSKMTIGGTTSGTNAGSYNATFTPGSNYQWTDGGSAEKAVAWTIGKATGSLSLNKSSISLNVSKMSDTITVTRPGTGVISAVSSAPSVASVSVSGNVVTVTGKAKGNATITVSVAADTNYSFDIAMQNELTLEENMELARKFVQEQFVTKGMIADLAFHSPEKEDGGIPNPHFHVMTTMRPLNPDGTWGQKQRREYLLDEDGNRIRDKNGDYMFNAVHTTDWHEPKTLEHWREQWAAAVNTKFEEKGLDVRIDHRSYVRQGLDLIPTVHEGANVRQMEAKGIRTEKGELNRWIKATNRLMQDVRKKIKALFVWMAEVKEELSKPQTPSLADLLIAYYNQRNAGAWSNKARTGNLKQFAEAVNYLTENKLLTLEDLQERLSSVNEEFEALSDSMKKKSARIKELQELIREGENYQRLKPVHTELNNIKFKKQREKFETSHDAELRLFYAARRILKEKLDGKPIALKAWKQEYAQLKTEYAELSPQHKPLREEVIRLRQVQNAVDTALRRREQPQAVQRKKHEMEL